MSWVDQYHLQVIELERDRDRWRQIAEMFADAVFSDNMGRITTESGCLATAFRAYMDEVRRDADRGRA